MPRGGRAPLKVLLLFVVVLLVLTSVELCRGGGPPFLLLGGRLVLDKGSYAWRKKKIVKVKYPDPKLKLIMYFTY
jgi:hypothetical protein